MEGSRRAIHAGIEGHRNALATMLRIAQIDVPMNSFNNSGRSAGVRVQAEAHSHVAAPLKAQGCYNTLVSVTVTHTAHEKSDMES